MDSSPSGLERVFRMMNAPMRGPIPEHMLHWLSLRQLRVLETIQAHPGIHQTELAWRVGLAPGCIVQPLEALMRVGAVETRAAHGYRCYFPAGQVDPRWLDAAPAVQGAAPQLLLDALARRPEGFPSLKAWADAAGVLPRVASCQVRHLREAGLVHASKQDRGVAVSLTPAGRMAADGTLADKATYLAGQRGEGAVGPAPEETPGPSEAEYVPLWALPPAEETALEVAAAETADAPA